jgi:FMN phosphatase YigB (HAD superfamily)
MWSDTRHSTVKQQLVAPRYSHAEVLVTRLVREGVRGLLLDWDGCMTPISGHWHGLIALEGLGRSPTFCAHASATLEDAISAYEGPGHGIDWFALFEQNLVRPKLSDLHNVEELVCRVMSDLRINVPIIADEFECGRLAPSLTIAPNPGVEDFLAASKEVGLLRSVVTMTPTAIVKAFASRSGLSRWIDEFHGCETFSHFEKTKADPLLWIEAAERVSCSMSEVAIVEDSTRSLQGAALSKPAALLSLTPRVEEWCELVPMETGVWIAEMLGDARSLRSYSGA